MAKILYRQMPAPRALSQQITASRTKARMQKPQGGGKFLVQIPGGVRGGMVMDEIDTCIRLQLHGAIYCPDSFVLMLRYCVNLKAIRHESTNLNRIIAGI